MKKTRAGVITTDDGFPADARVYDLRVARGPATFPLPSEYGNRSEYSMALVSMLVIPQNWGLKDLTPTNGAVALTAMFMDPTLSIFMQLYTKGAAPVFVPNIDANFRWYTEYWSALTKVIPSDFVDLVTAQPTLASRPLTHNDTSIVMSSKGKVSEAERAIVLYKILRATRGAIATSRRHIPDKQPNYRGLPEMLTNATIPLQQIIINPSPMFDPENNKFTIQARQLFCILDLGTGVQLAQKDEQSVAWPTIESTGPWRPGLLRSIRSHIDLDPEFNRLVIWVNLTYQYGYEFWNHPLDGFEGPVYFRCLSAGGKRDRGILACWFTAGALKLPYDELSLSSSLVSISSIKFSSS